MPKRLLNVSKILVGVLLSVLLLYLVFRNTDWVAFWSKAASTDLSWVIYSILLSIIAYVTRAYRWNILLKPLGYNLSTGRTTLAVLVGYLVNLAVPRLGEITRCGILKKSDNVSMPKGIGSVVTERIIDFLTLIFLFLISLVTEYETITGFLSTFYQHLSVPIYLPLALTGGFIIGLVVLFLIIQNQNRLKEKFMVLLKGFIDGFLSLTKIKNPVGFILSTVVIWIIYYLMSYIIVFSFPDTSHLGFDVGFMLLVTGGIAISIPVQSGFGTYHGMIAGMLLLHGVDKTTGLFLATLLHTSQIVATALFGSIALIILSLMQKKKNPTAELSV